jgi:redox-sensitive bicupin YhaK (pirin superfamily)
MHDESRFTLTSRPVERVVDSLHTVEGGGFMVQRPFPTNALREFDPFLLLDQMGPADYGPGQAKGAPDHPHRGFETVTYLLEGAFVHRDSHGNTGRLAPGDVQWMTAGAGVVHSEMPDTELQRRGGRLHGFQLWVNLPRADKMIRPRYQDIPSDRIPVAVAPDAGVTVKVIAGESLGKSAVIETRTPILYLHATLKPGAKFFQPMPADFNAFAYVVSGGGRVGRQQTPLAESQMAILGHRGDGVAIHNDGAAPLSVLLIGGRPLNEPVARYGPFVMNTPQELEQAFDDFRNGKMGEIPAG